MSGVTQQLLKQGRDDLELLDTAYVTGACSDGTASKLSDCSNLASDMSQSQFAVTMLDGLCGVFSAPRFKERRTEQWDCERAVMLPYQGLSLW